MAENGITPSHERAFPTGGDNLEMTVIPGREDPDRIEALPQEEGHGNTEHSNASGKDVRATEERHDPGVPTSMVGNRNEPVDDGSSINSIPDNDPRPEVATFRLREAQMLPICILSS
jgi:hypothetical protein